MAVGFDNAVERARGRGLRCTCWDHLRAAGLTPPAHRAANYPDVKGAVYESHNGQPERRANASKSDKVDRDVAAAIRNKEAQ